MEGRMVGSREGPHLVDLFKCSNLSRLISGEMAREQPGYGGS